VPLHLARLHNSEAFFVRLFGLDGFVSKKLFFGQAFCEVSLVKSGISRTSAVFQNFSFGKGYQEGTLVS